MGLGAKDYPVERLRFFENFWPNGDAEFFQALEANNFVLKGNLEFKSLVSGEQNRLGSGNDLRTNTICGQNKDFQQDLLDYFTAPNNIGESPKTLYAVNERRYVTAYIMLGSPRENGYCESFNARFRDEFLNGESFFPMGPVDVLAPF